MLKPEINLKTIFSNTQSIAAFTRNKFCNIHARCRVKVALGYTYVALRMRCVVRHLYAIELYTLDRKVCMVVRTCLWSNG